MFTTEIAETIFPAVPESVAAARRFTRAALARHAIDPEVIDTAMLLVSELATNAVIHGTSTIRLRVGVGDDIRVEVRDGNDDVPVIEVGSDGSRIRPGARDRGDARRQLGLVPPGVRQGRVVRPRTQLSDHRPPTAAMA